MSWLSKLLNKPVIITITRADIYRAMERAEVPIPARNEIDAMIGMYAPNGLKFTVKL